MDKEKIEAAIRQMEAVIQDPSTPDDLKVNLTQSLEQARTQLAEHERDPHGQKRLVDDCHVLLVEIRDSISGYRNMVLAGVDPRMSRQIAEHGTLLHTNELPPAPEQRFEDDFLVFDYRTAYFNEDPQAVALFNRLLQQPNAAQYKPLLMAVARDADRVLEALRLARKGEITAERVRQANQEAIRAAFYLNPLVMNLTDINVNINDYFPTFLVDALTEIARDWVVEAEVREEPGIEEFIIAEKGHKTFGYIINKDNPNQRHYLTEAGTWDHRIGKGKKFDLEEGRKKLEEVSPNYPEGLIEFDIYDSKKEGGRTEGEKIEVSLEDNRILLDLDGYHDLIAELRTELKEAGNGAQAKEKAMERAGLLLIDRLEVATTMTAEQRTRVLRFLTLDAAKKAMGKKGLFAKGGRTGSITIAIHKKGAAIEVDIAAYRKVQKAIIKKLHAEHLLKEHSEEADQAFKKQIRETFAKHTHFAKGISSTEKQKMVEHFEEDTWRKAHGRPGLFKRGGKVTFADKVKSISKNLVGKAVPKKYQKTEGKRFTKKTAAEAARRIVGKIQQKEKKGIVKKMLLGGAVIHAPGNMSLMDLNNLDIHSAGGAAVV